MDSVSQKFLSSLTKLSCVVEDPTLSPEIIKWVWAAIGIAESSIGPEINHLFTVYSN